MKALNVIVLLTALVFIYGCEKSTEPPAEQSTLDVTPEGVALTVTAPVDSSLVRLSCGCNFALIVEAYTGDTNVIHFEDRNATTDTYKARSLKFIADTSVAPGSYSTSLAIFSTGSKGDFRDTIRATYTK